MAWKKSFCFLVATLGGVLALPQRASNLARLPREISASNSGSSFTLLYPNNLNASDDTNHVAAIKTDPFPLVKAAGACQILGEGLLQEGELEAHEDEFAHLLLYEAYSGRADPSGLYYIDGSVVSVDEDDEGIAKLTFGQISNDRTPIQSCVHNQIISRRPKRHQALITKLPWSPVETRLLGSETSSLSAS